MSPDPFGVFAKMNETLIVVLKYTTPLNNRFSIFWKCIHSLIETTKGSGVPNKIVLVDNGGNSEQEAECLNLFHQSLIHAYLRVPNLDMGHGRNAGLDIGLHILPIAKFVVFVDDDIFFLKNGWLEECVEILNTYSDKKLIASPIHTRCHLRPPFERGTLPDGRLLNSRAGSNCSFFRYVDYIALGKFSEVYNNVAVCGPRFTDWANKNGFLTALTHEPLTEDLAYGIHGYVPREATLLEHIFKTEKLPIPKNILQIGSDYSGYPGAYLLYIFPSSFLTIVDFNSPNTEISQLQKAYPDRYSYMEKSEYLTERYDCIILNDQHTTSNLEEEVLKAFSLMNTNGLLIGVSKENLKKQSGYYDKLSKLLGRYNTYGSHIWWSTHDAM